MFDDAGDRRAERRGQRLAFRSAKGVSASAPARQMDVPAGTLLARGGLGQEARLQAHRGGDVLDRHLGEHGVVRRAQRGTSPKIQLEKAGARFRMDGGKVNTKSIQRRGESAEKFAEPAQLAQAVAEAAGKRLALGVPEPHLVLDGGDGLVAHPGQGAQDPAKDLTRIELARGAVRPARRCEADLPARPPGQVVKGADIGSHQQIAGT